MGEAVDENKDEMSMEELKYESMRHRYEIGYGKKSVVELIAN